MNWDIENGTRHKTLEASLLLNWHIEKDIKKDGLSINSYIEKTQDPNLALIVQWHKKEITNTTCWKQDTRPQKLDFEWIHTLKT